MHAIRCFWRASHLTRRTVPLVGGVLIGVQVYTNANLQKNKALAAWFGSSSTPPSPPPVPSPPSQYLPSLKVGPYGPTSFDFPNEEMARITSPAVKLLRASLVGSERGIQAFGITLWGTWASFSKDVQDLPSENLVKEKIKDQVQLFKTKLPAEGHKILGDILSTLGLKNLEQLYEEFAQKARDLNVKTVMDAMPHSLRVMTRLRELRQWEEILSQQIGADIKVADTPLADVPARYQQLFLEKLKKEYPKLDDDVAKLMSENANLRAKMNIVQPYLENNVHLDPITIDNKFKLFVATARWTSEYLKTKQSDKLDQFIIDKAKKDNPKISQKEQEEVVAMAKELESFR